MSFAKIEIACAKLACPEFNDNRARMFFGEFESFVGGFSSNEMCAAAGCFWSNYWKYREGKLSYRELKKWAKSFGYDSKKY